MEQGKDLPKISTVKMYGINVNPIIVLLLHSRKEERGASSEGLLFVRKKHL